MTTRPRYEHRRRLHVELAAALVLLKIAYTALCSRIVVSVFLMERRHAAAEKERAVEAAALRAKVDETEVVAAAARVAHERAMMHLKERAVVRLKEREEQAAAALAAAFSSTKCGNAHFVSLPEW